MNGPFGWPQPASGTGKFFLLYICFLWGQLGAAIIAWLILPPGSLLDPPQRVLPELGLIGGHQDSL